MTAFAAAADSIDETERRHTRLSERQAAGLLQWILNGRTDHAAGAGGQAEGNPVSGISCVMCGGRVYSVPALEANYESTGSPLDHWWLCPSDRKRMVGLMGTPSSPGRPSAEPPKSASQLRIEKYRRMSAAAAERRAQGPKMPKPGSMRPVVSAPTMPRPSIFG